MSRQIQVIGPKDLKNYKDYINVTSSGDEFKALSPFFLGPLTSIHGTIEAKNFENAWQFSKVYKKHLDKWGNPSTAYFAWAVKGWNDSFAHRYPMGKGAKPEYFLYGVEKLDYLEARKRFYVPFYSILAQRTEAFNNLCDKVRASENIVLFDYDGYSDYDSLEEVLNNPKRKMGHAFVLAMMLEKYTE